MLPKQSEEAFRRFLGNSRLGTATLDLASGFEQAVSFYENVTADGIQSEPDADMLLYQWGTYDWLGAGETFQINLTRQFVASFADEDETMSQLLLTFHYPTTDATITLNSGERWLGNGRRGLAEWSEYVRAGVVFKEFAVVVPDNVELRWEHV